MDQEKLFSFESFIFDLYGTLIDIRTDEWAIETWLKWCEFLDKEGIKHPTPEVFREEFFAKDREYRQRPTRFDYPEIDVLEVYDELFYKYGNAPIDKERLFEISYRFREASTVYKKLFPGVEAFLKGLRSIGKGVYILSNAQSSYTLYEIQEFKLDEMCDDYIMSSDFRCMKPDKAFYDEIIKRNNIVRDKAIMFGDSYENDYLGAINSGLSAIWLNGDDRADVFYIEHAIFNNA